MFLKIYVTKRFYNANNDIYFFQIALLLLKHGGDPYRKNDMGETPVDVAEDEEISKALRTFNKDMLVDMKQTKSKERLQHKFEQILI